MTRSSILPLRCKQSLVIICLILSGSLSGCTKSIDRATPVEWVRVFPPPGLLVPCYKPPIKATTPAQLVEEVMRLKFALKQCARYIDDYFLWYQQVLDEPPQTP
ncbi:TPA: Rz1-like lysis system protein LysC [Photobacterium damselae]